MEDGTAWVPETVWTLRKIEKYLDDTKKRKTFLLLCKTQRCHSTEYVIPDSENGLFYAYLV